MLSRKLSISIGCLLTLAVTASAQYFLKEPPRGRSLLKSSVLLQAQNAKFDDQSAVKKSISGETLTFTPSAPQKGATIEQLKLGFLLGKLTTTEKGYLGTGRDTPLPAGTYHIWLTRPNLVWKIVATDDKGNVKASTKEVTLHMDKHDTREFYSKISAEFLEPPYALTPEKPGVGALADEGPPTVHGCRCVTIWTTIDDPYKPGRGTTCWPYTRCSCW